MLLIAVAVPHSSAVQCTGNHDNIRTKAAGLNTEVTSKKEMQ